MAEIQLFEEITQDTLGSVSEQLKAVPDGEEVELCIASPGGELLTAFAIIDLMKASGKKFIATIAGYAASAAAIIALACDRVRMSPLGLLMLHSAWCEDDDEDAGIAKCNEQQLRIIKNRNPDLDEALFKQDNWYTASDALQLGLVDEIYNDEQLIFAACSKIAAKIQNNTSSKRRNTMSKKVMAEAEIPVEEMVEQVVEEKEEEKVEEQVEEPKGDLMDVVEKLIERVNELEKRIEEMRQPKEEVVVEGACGEDDDKRDQERIGAMLKSLVRPQACAPIGIKAEAAKKVIRIDTKKFKSFLND